MINTREIFFDKVSPVIESLTEHVFFLQPVKEKKHALKRIKALAGICFIKKKKKKRQNKKKNNTINKAFTYCL